MKTICVTRSLLEQDAASIQRFARMLGITPEDDPHVTLIYSKVQVDHCDPAFAMDQEGLEIEPENLSFDRFGDCIVLRFKHPATDERNAELRAAGAVSDFPEYNSHITIGKDPDNRLMMLPDDPYVDGPWVFGPEKMKLVGPDAAKPSPKIAEQGYRLDNVATFLACASTDHIKRFERDCRESGEFIIWDPQDDQDGMMICLPEIDDLNAEFESFITKDIPAPNPMEG